ncbi:hypothetical protein JTE90_017320 [Oedothorax gibbosus]|uniref:Uncharacterized protein n=1 Tax=Oedothorax gibbosus TaxID=931172 RepID=A0AAV6UC01_9ARAC|nr:hypothetical protein JTE90_017320 [Oedothorax gibbosus]
MDEKLKGLKTQKKVTKSSLTRLKNKLDKDIDDLDLIELNVKRNRLVEINAEIKAIFNGIFEVCDEKEIDEYCEEKEVIMDECETLLVKLDRSLSKFSKTPESNTRPGGRVDVVEIKLPTLSLPTFSGAIDECKNTCRKCGKSHHTLLHFENASGSRTDSSTNPAVDSGNLSVDARVFVPSTQNCSPNSNSEPVNPPVSSFCSDFGPHEQVLLCTALVKVCDSVGGTQLCRALLDPGSQEDVLAEEEDLTLVDDDVKVLGMKWNPRTDLFGFKVTPCEKKKNFSKREILAETSRVFDPIGFISPCVVLMKILLQDVWKQNLAWDQPIPEELNKRWLTFCEEFHLIEQVEIPRCVLQPQDLGTRGLLPSQLIDCEHWFRGPPWLLQPMDEFSTFQTPELVLPETALMEEKKIVASDYTTPVANLSTFIPTSQIGSRDAMVLFQIVEIPILFRTNHLNYHQN